VEIREQACRQRSIQSVVTPSLRRTRLDVENVSESEEQLSSAEVKRRAVSGAAIDGVRGLGLRAVALIGTAFLARMLSPEAFGLTAIGTTVLGFGSFLSDGGIATALIRRSEAPSRRDLRAFLAFQLILTVVLASVIAVVMVPFGELGAITALMMLSLPLGAFRVPSTIMLERRLNYRTFAFIDAIETACYYAWSLATVSVGWGVWGLASGAVIRTLVGTVAMLIVFAPGRLTPSPSWQAIRPMLGFGFKFQAAGFVQMLRDQGINLAIAAFGGVAELGLWNVAFKFLQIPILLFSSLWRVSFPGMSRLVNAREEMSHTIERVIALVAVAAGLMLAPLAASASDVIPVLLGGRWSGAASAIPPASLNLLIAAPVSVALAGYLWAVGEAGAVFRSTWLQIPATLAVLFVLLPVIGVSAVGVSWIAAGIIEVVVFLRAARKHVEIAVASRVAPPSIAAVTGALVGWLGATLIDSHLVGGIVAALLAAAVYLLVLWILHRQYLRDALVLGSRGLRGALHASSTG
jgi:O-antigen/teichoic acid export membrane protein